jgi:hypothetical protein
MVCTTEQVFPTNQPARVLSVVQFNCHFIESAGSRARSTGTEYDEESIHVGVWLLFHVVKAGLLQLGQRADRTGG